MATEIYPVIHINDEPQALSQVEVALEQGAQGVYLIDHTHFTPDFLLSTYEAAATQFPDSFIGVNILCHPSASTALSSLITARNKGKLSTLPQGLWVDNARINLVETGVFRAEHPETTAIKYLGGVAFKYTDHYTDDPSVAAHEAMICVPYVDVVTTSGAGTGQPPTVDKLRAMKEILGKRPLAVASGVDVDNLPELEPYIDELLVASSVETAANSGYFDKAKLADLIELTQLL